MSFTIYTGGDASFLSEVFNSVAMVSGSGAIASVAAVGALITVLLLGFRAILEGGRAIRFEELLLGFIVYMIAFYPTTTVTIEDGHTGHVHVVDNVPLGPAAAGWVVSSIGYKLTTIFETGYRFSSHGSNDSLHRFAEPLELLMLLRSSASNPLLMSAWNQHLGPYADMRRSWENYYKHCALIKVDLGLVTVDQILHGNVLEVTKFDSEVYGTQLFLGDQGGTEHTCKDAHELLKQATQIGTTAGGPADVLLHGILTRGMEDDSWGAGQSAVDKIESAVSPLIGYGMDIQQYMHATILSPVFNDAVEGRYLDMQDVGAAIAFRQALAQRNTQWSQEASAFMTTIRPAMTFFEGFVYAITPMMAMLLVMGRFGMTLAGKYLQTIFWVQLWLPILSICNLYIRNAAEKQIHAIYAQASGFGTLHYESFYMANNIPEVVETWLGIGSMLAAATPILSFFLISGSAYAFSNVAGRLSGQDHFDEKQVTPDAVKVGAAHDVAAMMKHSAGAGGSLSGTDGFAAEVSLSEGYANELSSANSNELAAKKGFSNAFSQAMKQSVGNNQTYQTMKSLEEGSVFNKDKTTGLNQSVIDGIHSTTGVEKTRIAQHIMSVGAAASAGIEFAGFGAKVMAETKKNWSDAEAQKYEEAIKIAASHALTNGMGASLMDQAANKFSEGNSQSFFSGAESSTTNQLNETAEKYVASKQQVTELSNKKDGYANSQKYKYNEVGANIHRNGLGGDLAAIVGSDSNLTAAANQSEKMFKSTYGWGDQVARNAGMFNAIMQHGTSDQRIQALDLLAQTTAGYSGRGPAVDNTHLQGVDPNSVQRTSVGSVEDKSKTEVSGQNLQERYAGSSGELKETHQATRNREAALNQLEMQANMPVPAHSYLNATTLQSQKNAATAIAVNAVQQSGLSTPMTNAMLRQATMQQNAESGRFDEFANELAPKLSPGAAGYLMETRLGGGFEEFTQPALSKWRDEYAVPDEHGNIQRDANGMAILSPESERHFQLNKTILDKHGSTTSAAASQDIGSMSVANEMYGIKGSGSSGRAAAFEAKPESQTGKQMYRNLTTGFQP